MHSEQVIQNGIERAKEHGRPMSWLRKQLFAWISRGYADREDLKTFDRLIGNTQAEKVDPLQGELF